MDADIYWEADTAFVGRHFDIRLHEVDGVEKWSVELIPEFAERGPYPPGQEVLMASSGYCSLPAVPWEDGDWACRPWFLSHEAAWLMAQEWGKKHRNDLYEAALAEVRAGRRWRGGRSGEA